MTVTTIDLDPELLETARALTGVRSNRAVVIRALQTLIATRHQPAAVERVIARPFTDEQTSAGVVRWSAPGIPEA
jgi:Arc/MetJ family transcription regulator